MEEFDELIPTYCIACNEEYSLPEDTENCPICGCKLGEEE